ncbi:MAG: bifunctional fructose-bisphosphatase/inositol-phosphate phosphatase [Halobacteria archaeon]|nr:bifunctional fructose-bisphosphatase/inositol-phosphate phosphatase [Halobacteria archaeon]
MHVHELCKRVADKVEEVTHSEFGDPTAGEVVGMGADGTPTKKIDEIAEQAALETVEDYGDVRVVTEEEGEVVYGDPDFTMVLDPIDGTYNSSKGIPIYSVSIAIAWGDSVQDVEYAYVRELNSGETYTAERGEGAYFEDTKIEVTNEETPANMTVGGVYNIYDFDPTEFKRIRVLGCSSLEMCYVAAGRLDGFLDMRSLLRVLDFAAAKLIIEEAGGVVTDGYGHELENVIAPNQRSSVVAANPRAHDNILEVVSDE